MNTLNVFLTAETQGEVEHCRAFLDKTLNVKVVQVDDLKRGLHGVHWFTLETEVSVPDLQLALLEAGFEKAEVFDTKFYL